MTFPADHKRRALQTLAEAPRGRQEWFLRARGITKEVLVELLDSGLAMRQLEVTGGREVRRIRLTDAGRQTLRAFRCVGG